MRITGIKLKVLAGTVAIVLGFGLTMLLFVRMILHENLHDALEKRGMFIVERLAQDSIQPVLTERYFELQLMLNDLKQDVDDVAYAFVQRDDGQVLAHTFGQGFPDDLRRLGGDERVRLLATGEDRIYDFSAPLFHGVGGRVHMGLREEPLRRDINDTLRLLSWGILVVMVLGAGAAVLMALSITRPVDLLAAAVGEMEKGRTGIRVPVRSDDEVGQLAAAFNSMADARERFETSLRASERKLRDITASLGEGILVVDPAGTLTFMNPEAERLLGWSEAELAGKHLHDVIHFRKPDGSPSRSEECPSRQVAVTGKRAVVEDDIYIRKDGSEFPVSYISAPIIAEGSVQSVVIAFQDISMRKRSEAEREQLMIEHLDALSQVKVLSGMLPICLSCKKIRDDAGYWKQLESYIHEHSEAEFSHGICPDCAVKLYPDVFKKDG